MENKFYFIIVLLIIFGCTKNNDWQTFFPNIHCWWRENYEMIPKEMILHIKTNMYNRSINALDTEEMIELSYDELKVFGNNQINITNVVDLIISNSLYIAEEKKQLALNPFFKRLSNDFINESHAYYNIACNTKLHRNKLKPYLVRAIKKGKGNFNVFIKNRELYILHTSLGSESFGIIKQPIIVFLEDKPEKLFLDVSTVK